MEFFEGTLVGLAGSLPSCAITQLTSWLRNDQYHEGDEAANQSFFGAVTRMAPVPKKEGDHVES